MVNKPQTRSRPMLHVLPRACLNGVRGFAVDVSFLLVAKKKKGVARRRRIQHTSYQLEENWCTDIPDTGGMFFLLAVLLMFIAGGAERPAL